MGESTNPRTTLRFDRRVRLEFRGATITSDAGLLACRELDDALGLTQTANECLQESRGGRNVQHRLVGLLRQSVYSRLAGYEDTNDAERLAQDPTMRIIVGRRDIDRPAASTNTMSRFETEVLTQDGNVEGLDRLNAEWVDGAMSRTPHRRVILDMDSSESPVHGEQEGASYNGHFGSMCYHPLFVFNQFGDCEGAMLRAGNVHSSHRWRDVLDPILSRYGATGVRRYFRADAAFAKPDIYEYLEERRVFYAIRLPSNKVLQYEIAPLLIRPVGRPPKRPVILYDDFWYRAESWGRARRVVAKVEWHRGELFPRVGFIVTNMTAGPEGVVRFYNGSWDSRAVDQGREVRAELDSAVVPSVRGQPGASVSVRPGVQPWELPSPAVPAQGGQALVAAERAGQADQDGRPSGAALPVVDLSVIRGVGSSTVVRGSVGSYRPVIAGAKLREDATTILPRGRVLQGVGLSSMRFHPLAGARRRQRWTRSMVHGKNRIPYWIDRRLTGLAGPDYDATISFGLPFEPEDSQYGKYRVIGLGSNCAVELEHPQPLDSGSGAGITDCALLGTTDTPLRHARQRRPLHNRHSRAGGNPGLGFPARNASHLRHAVSHRGSYAKISESGHPSVWRNIRALNSEQ